jgi:cation diffusion facilitator family transporter
MKKTIAGISVLVNLVLAIGKIIIGLAIKSSAILAEGIHSGMDVFSSLISLVGINASSKPKDKEHPYGHYKFEVMSGLVITILLFLAGIWTIYEAIKGFISPNIISISYLGLGIMILSVILNEIMARIKTHIGKKENSLSLLSDGIHDKVDVYTSLAIFIGLIIMPYWIYIDSILAFLIGLYIIKESFSLGKEATDSLLDVSAGDEIENKIKSIGKSQDIVISDIKTQKKGSVITANIMIKLPKTLSVEEATKISERLQNHLMEEINNLSYVAIQIKSHDLESNYFEPIETLAGIKIGQGFGWQRHENFTKNIPNAKKIGPEVKCICNKCGHKIEHKRGIPCSTIKCPKCKIPMTRG